MSRVQTIFKSMSWLLASNIVGFICGFIWTILIARYLQVSEYGILGFATSLSGILAFSTDWGIPTYIVRHVSTDRSVAGIQYKHSMLKLYCTAQFRLLSNGIMMN